MARQQRTGGGEAPRGAPQGSVGALLRQIARTRPSQLLGRASAVAKRALHDTVPTFALGEPPRAIEAARQPPQPVFAPRFELVRASPGGPRALFLGVERDLTSRIDWRSAKRPALERFHLHYMEYLEALDDAQFTRLCVDWIERNPRRERGSWRGPWASYVISLRSVVWMQQLAERGARVDIGARERIVASLVEQLAHLEAHLEVDLGGNHLLKNLKALLWGSRFFEGAAARRWGALAARGLVRELREQVLPDGLHFERSPSYHAQVFADLVECAHVAPNALRAQLETVLAPMAQALVDLTHPDGLTSLFSDGGLHASYGTEECLRAWSRLTGNAAPQPRRVFSLASAGYFGLRLGGTCVIADCGSIAPEHLPAHGHGDVLAFEWTIGGERIVVDAGVFEYEPGPSRADARATRSHNTLTIDDHDQAEFLSSFRVGRRPKVTLERFEQHALGFMLQGSHDGYAHLPGAPVHRRRLVASGESLCIHDEVLGGRGQQVRSRMLLHPEVTVERDDFHRVILRRGDVEVLVEARDMIEVVAASWCPDFGVRLATRQLVFCHPPAPSSGRITMARLRTPPRDAMASAAVASALPSARTQEVRP